MNEKLEEYIKKLENDKIKSYQEYLMKQGVCMRKNLYRKIVKNLGDIRIRCQLRMEIRSIIKKSR